MTAPMNCDGTECCVIIISGLTDHDGPTAGKLHYGGSLRSIQFSGPKYCHKVSPRGRQCIHKEQQTFRPALSAPSFRIFL